MEWLYWIPAQLKTQFKLMTDRRGREDISWLMDIMYMLYATMYAWVIANKSQQKHYHILLIL